MLFRSSLDIKSIYRYIVTEMITIREKVIKVNHVDYASVLSDYINQNLSSILVLREEKVIMEPRNQIVARLVSDQNLLQVSKTDFKKYLNSRQISSREFEFDMRSRDILIEDRKGRLTTGWKNAIQVEPSYLYWFRTTLPDELFNNENADPANS